MSAAIGLSLAAAGPAGAAQPAACSPVKATIFHAAGDRYRGARRYLDAGHWFLAAARSLDPCRSADRALLAAQLRAQAGAAFAQGGDDLRGRALLDRAAADLHRIEATHPHVAAAAGEYRLLVEHMIAAIDSVAEASM